MSADKNEMTTKILEHSRMLSEAIKLNLKLEKRSKEINEGIMKINSDLLTKAPGEHSEIEMLKFEVSLYKLHENEKKLVSKIKEKDLIIANLVSIVDRDAV